MVEWTTPMAEENGRVAGDMTRVDKGMLARLLFPNPVCLLSSRGDASDVRNVMTITWLTPINNQGGFVCSVNAGRHSAGLIGSPGAIFVLSVPVRGMEELVLAVGGTSGADGDKVTRLGIATCAPGGGDVDWQALDEDAGDEAETSESNKKRKLSKKELARREVESATRRAFAIRDCAAHLLCRVETVAEDDGHLLLRCSQLAGWVREEYWDGRNFLPRDDRSPPYMTFLGSKVFGYVMSADALPAAPDNVADQSISSTKA